MPLELSLLDHPALLNIFWEYPYIDVFAAYILIHYKAVFCFFILPLQNLSFTTSMPHALRAQKHMTKRMKHRLKVGLKVCMHGFTNQTTFVAGVKVTIWLYIVQKGANTPQGGGIYHWEGYNMARPTNLWHVWDKIVTHNPMISCRIFIYLKKQIVIWM